MRIFITGSPGVGKSTVSKVLSKKLGIPHIDVAKLALSKGCVIRYLKDLKTYEIDINRLKQVLLKEIKNLKSYIIDSHIVEVAPSELIDYVFVLRLHPDTLYKRLLKRGYPERKIQENIMSEILDSCLISALNHFGKQKVHEINTTNKEVNEVVEEILEVIRGKREKIYGIVDWISQLEKEGKLSYFLK